MVDKNGIIAIPPGETIKEQLDYRNMTQVEFAERMGQSTKHISQLLNGKVPLTQQTALKLESVLGIPAKFWNNLEAIYQEDLARIALEVELEKESEIAKQIPYNEMVKKGWLKAARKITEKVYELRKYFEIASLNQIPNINDYAIAFRKADHGKASNYALSAWVQKALLDAREVHTDKFNKKKLEASLPSLRALVNQPPEVFQDRLATILSSAGVAVVFLPHLSGTYAHGATLWPNRQKAVIVLTIRGKDADKFWFSFFHEVGHLLLHDKNETYIHYDNPNDNDDKEHEADRFASNFLIPEDKYKNFTMTYIFSEASITSFANEINLPAGIVVGRLQHDGLIHFSEMNHLKVKYEWVHNA